MSTRTDEQEIIMSTSWQPENPAGHAPWCVTPGHPASGYCAGSPDEPETLRGLPSRAWRRDHPDAGPVKLVQVRTSIDYSITVMVPADADADHAIEEANKTDIAKWDQSWGAAEAEDIT